ncbi:hypothetical protein [Bacillus toyonensis]|uniref:hypothetical protein n=1 Tax=Bacillus toyonensis TaxID=155322 RepID=UPI002E1C4C97|nr:hypothetical protein [Bacillus toyonensis]
MKYKDTAYTISELRVIDINKNRKRIVRKTDILIVEEQLTVSKFRMFVVKEGLERIKDAILFEIDIFKENSVRLNYNHVTKGIVVPKLTKIKVNKELYIKNLAKISVSNPIKLER